MKTIKLYGGYHNAPETKVRISDNAYCDLKNGNSTLSEVLTQSQQKRLDRHFCGLNGCKCGSFMRATIEF